MSAELSALVGSGQPAQPAIDEFLKAHTFPLVDPLGVTFVYAGEASAVYLRMFVAGLPAAQPLERIGSSPLWALRLDLPPGSRFEYKFEVCRDGRSEWITDPLNPHLAQDPYGANSVGQGYGYQEPEWTQPDPGARRGSYAEHELDAGAFGTRRVRVYLPARFRRSRRYPLLIAHDGLDYLRYAALGVVLDNLIHRLEVAPLIVALLEPRERLVEYVANDAHAEFVATRLVPELEGAYPLDSGPESRGLMGASLGAVASLHCAWRYPGRFGRLLLQSGSFVFSDLGGHGRGPVFEPVARFVNAFRRAPGRPAGRCYMSCGIYESLIYENRSLLPVLARSLEVRLEEVNDGHNWQNWRDRQRTALSWLFPGPLWMVYE
jgi:enterochelin esterase-like enzyme